MRLNCVVISVLSLLLASTVLTAFASASNTYYSTNYFPSSSGCYLNFEDTQTFDNVYTVSPSNSSWAYWIFFDIKGFYLADCNATVTTFFQEQRLQLETSGSSATATLKVYYPSEHSPETITGSSDWSFETVSSVTTVTFPANTSISIDWGSHTGGGGGLTTPQPSQSVYPTDEPTTTPTIIPDFNDRFLLGVAIICGVILCLFLIVANHNNKKKYTNAKWSDPHFG